MQTKWVNDLSGQPFIEMIKIPAGNFTMGSDESSYNSEKPERDVFLHDYYISKYPITNKQFFHFLQETGYSNSEDNFLRHWETNPDGIKSPPEELLDHPVVYVNWFDCYAFCKTYGLTLPTEARWEKAARGSDKRIYPWGNEEPDSEKPQCNFRNIFDGTTPVGIFDGSRDSYNGIPVQKGSSPYGVQDMAGNVWEWCLDEWDSEWLKNMGENPEDPCNYQKRNRQGLTLEQVRSLYIQQQEAEGQLPFRDTEYCGAVRGTTTLPPTSAPPLASTSSRRSGTTTSGCVVAYKEAEEQVPFQITESYGAVRGNTSIPATSVPSIVTAATCRTGTASSALDVASKEEVEEQLPFRNTESCEAARGTSTVPSTSVPSIASTTTHQTGSTASACVVASDQQEAKEDQFPFRNTESCGEVRGSAAVPTAFAPPIATTSSRRTGSIFSALDAPPEQEAEEVLPFHNTECCGEVRGTSLIPPSSAPPIAATTTRRSGTPTTASESAPEKQEAEEKDQNPFQGEEYCGADRGSTSILPTFASPVPSLATSLIPQTGTTIMALDVSSEQEEREQLPFSGYRGLRGGSLANIYADLLRIVYRGNDFPSDGYGNYGFRGSF